MLTESFTDFTPMLKGSPLGSFKYQEVLNTSNPIRCAFRLLRLKRTELGTGRRVTVERSLETSLGKQ